MDPSHDLMDPSTNPTPGYASQCVSSTTKSKTRTRKPRSRKTNPKAEPANTVQQTTEEQARPQRSHHGPLRVEFSFSAAGHSVSAAPFPNMSQGFSGDKATPVAGGAPGSAGRATPGDAARGTAVNTPQDTPIGTPRGATTNGPTISQFNPSATTTAPVPTPNDPAALQRFHDAVTAIPLTTNTTSTYLDHLTVTYNTHLRPPTARIYDVLFLHAYLFHTNHLLLELPLNKKTWRPPQYTWHADSLPRVPRAPIADLALWVLERAGCSRTDVVAAWPDTHHHSVEVTHATGKRTFCWMLDTCWEVRLDARVKGVGANWRDVGPRVQGVGIGIGVGESGSDAQAQGVGRFGTRLRWFTEDEVRSGWEGQGQEETLLKELVQMILGAFRARREREDEFLEGVGQGGR